MFPSLGATAFLFFETPMAEVASPRNTIIGHCVGAAIAFCWLVVFGLTDAPSALEAGFTLERAAAVALSVGCTGGVLRLLRAAHPPAGRDHGDRERRPADDAARSCSCSRPASRCSR